MKKLLILPLLVLCSCSNTGSFLSSPQGAAAIASATQIASVAVAAAATQYGGQAAGQYASAGLNALGSVMQGYVGYVAAQKTVVAAPGVANVGNAVAPLIPTTTPITQTDVNTVYQAAAIASKTK